ncbi:DinB family protein [Ensifer sp. ENS04]|uniref:DinB family protein n=1 Tax=Ensifer sp. ENS04 TaxID=2769281 RepID=UPI00178379E7|nr:DinB family protein [Ensifer sp. ENS04]MBD9538909.1 DinB family protein [Ensifer sp. ENS04]
MTTVVTAINPTPGDAPQASLLETLRTLIRYKAWANELTYETVIALPEEEALLPRQTRFGNIVHTLNHVYVVDDIFRHHLEGRKHSYTSRNTEHTPPVSDLWDAVREMDRWYVDQVHSWSPEDVSETIRFEFVGGGAGAMTRQDIILHLVNHATYHRGFVGDMLYQAGVTPPANDLTVYTRDVK